MQGTDELKADLAKRLQEANDYLAAATEQRALAAEPDKTTMQREYHLGRELQFRMQHQAARKLASAARMKLASLAAAVLTACGGGGSDAPAAEPAKPTASAPCTAPRVALYGDSTVDQAWPPMHLQHQMDLRFGVGKVLIENRAVSGTSLEQLMAGTDGKNGLPWAKQLDVVKPQVAVVQHAKNSMAARVPVATFKAELEQLVREAKGRGVSVILDTPVPETLNAPYGAQWRVDGIKPYAQAIRDVSAANGVPLVDVTAITEAIPGYEALVFDGIHQDLTLTQILYTGPVADAIATAVGPMVCR
jgi:lysophospholipase L1-like esterase